jgi:hypothetical protein
MSFRLSKNEIASRDEIIARLEKAAAEVTAAVEAANAAIEAATEPVNGAIERYNEIVGKAREFAADVASQAESDIGDKSERWQEGERGQAAQEWQQEWEGLSFEDIELELPQPIDFDDPGYAEMLGSAPEEASE